VYGVDPSKNIAALAIERGVPTVVDLFGPAAVEAIGKKADIITSTNTFNHISDVRAFMDSIDSLLAPDGMFVFEVPYLLDLVKQTAFDTIYLEHILFFAVKPFAAFFASRGYAIAHIERTSYMGGSIRVAISRHAVQDPEVLSLIAQEEAAGLFSPETYVDFMGRVRGLKERLMDELQQLVKDGAVVMGPGAAQQPPCLLFSFARNHREHIA
jgi:SAM-dependent methyltransferase